MATQNAQMAHKVEVVDEVKTRMAASTASDRERVPRPDRGRAGRPPPRAGRRRRRLQDLQEHARAPGHRRRRVPAARGVPERPERADLRPGRHQRGGQGAARLLAGQPAPRDQGRAGRRLAALALRPGRAGRPAAPRGPAGPPGRRPGGADAADGRPAQGAAAEPGLRDLGADRAAGRRRGGRAGSARPRPRGRVRGRGRCAGDAGLRRGSRTRGRRGHGGRSRWSPPRTREATPRRRPAPEAEAAAEGATEAEAAEPAAE